MSYADLYRACEKYNEQGKLTPKDLNLSSKTKLEEIINEYIVKQINHKLKENPTKSITQFLFMSIQSSWLHYCSFWQRF